MKLLWLCLMQPGVVRSHITGKPESGVNWVDHVLAGLREKGVCLRILCQGSGERGELDGLCGYATFAPAVPYQYSGEQERFFRQEIQSFQPDVIHIWGTEFGHTLAMVNAAEAEGLLEHTVASIQGLCGPCARHYNEGVPEKLRNRFTLRDLLRMDNLRQQQRNFYKRGELERRALEKLHYVIGRTDWDYACVRRVNPGLKYLFCNETLRKEFYCGAWSYGSCRKHRIFAPSRLYPIKGFHYLLEAFAEVLKSYPDATLAVTGQSFLKGQGKDWLHIDGYERYLRTLARAYYLEDHLEFLGHLSAEGMKNAFLEANVFCLPSTIENSPNSLGEAMLLGVPCVASDVGGVKNMMEHGKEGFVYQSTAPYMLSYYIQRTFEMEEQAGALGQAAREHARRTHDPETNLDRLMKLYRDLAEGSGV